MYMYMIVLLQLHSQLIMLVTHCSHHKQQAQIVSAAGRMIPHTGHTAMVPVNLRPSSLPRTGHLFQSWFLHGGWPESSPAIRT